jgi:hypothetical protein
MDFIEWRSTSNRNVEVLNGTVDLYRYFDCTEAAEFLYACVRRSYDKCAAPMKPSARTDSCALVRLVLRRRQCLPVSYDCNFASTRLHGTADLTHAWWVGLTSVESSTVPAFTKTNSGWLGDDV